MIRAVVIAAALLSGCASYSEMQASAPLLELETAKSPAEYAGCVMPKARELWRSMVSIAPDGDSQVIVVQSDVGVVWTTTISPIAMGSAVIHRGRGRSDPHDVVATLHKSCI